MQLLINGEKREYPSGTTWLTVAKDYQKDYQDRSCWSRSMESFRSCTKRRWNVPGWNLLRPGIRRGGLLTEGALLL